MKRAIISGATGAIGTALVQKLINEGTQVLVLCRNGSQRLGVLPNNSLIKKLNLSLHEYASFENNSKEKYDVFYHFAWIGTCGSARNDVLLQSENIKYTLDAVALAKKFGCHTFIGAGSQAEYGRVEGILTSQTPVFPENGYGIAKLCAGRMSKEYARQLGINHIWVRILSVYGPHDGSGTMVSSTITKLKNGEKAQFTKGEQLWDYLYSSDAAEAFRLLGERGVDGKTYVLGSGKARKLSDYIRIIGKRLCAENLLEFGSIPYAEKQVMYLCADISELERDTGWKPEIDFESGIDKICCMK